MNLYVSSFEKVSERDLIDFLGLERPESERLSEGTRLEFNVSIPDNIGEDVSSFANSAGGLIFIGVASDKTKQNIPVDLPGLAPTPDLETQVSSKVDATVRPRPDFEVKAVKTAKGTYVLVVRVRKGSYPPYEYQRGDKVRISLRVHDHKRTATLRDIEGLLRERSSTAANPEPNILQYINAQHFEPTKPQVTGGQSAVEVFDYDLQRIAIVPRVSVLLRLDGGFENEFDKLVFRCFPNEPNEWGHDRTGDYFQIEAKRQHPKCRWHHLWRIYRSGALAYTGGLVGDFPNGKPIGDLALDLLSMCALAERVFSRLNVFGDVDIGYFVRAPNAVFLPKFPAPDMFGDYDVVRGIQIPETRPLVTDRSFSSTLLDTSELSTPEVQIADLIMYNLRELRGAKFNYEHLLNAIRTLRAQFRTRLAQSEKS